MKKNIYVYGDTIYSIYYIDDKKIYNNNLHAIINYYIYNDINVNYRLITYNLKNMYKYIIEYLNIKKFIYNDNSINLKSCEYTSYINMNNKPYYINIRYKNKWIKILDFELMANEKIINKNITENLFYIKNFTEKIIKIKNIETTASKIAIKNFENKCEYKIKKIYPILNNSQYNFIKKSFLGGLNFFNKENVKNKNKNVYVYDINSLYPYIMANCKLPYGDPIYYKGEYKKNNLYDLYIQHVKVDFKIKKNYKCKITIANDYNINIDNDIIDSGGRLIDLYLTCIDIKIFLENYDINEIYYIDGIKFKSNNLVFKKYINYYYNKKQKAKNLDTKKYYKILLNGLYGKFSSKKNVIKKRPVFINNKLKIVKSENEIKSKGGYNAISVFVCAYGREKLYSDIKKNYDKFIYCDTDSIHANKEIKNIKISNKIGDYKLEYKKINAKYLDKKNYILYKKNKIIKCVIVGASDVIKEKINLKKYKKNNIIKYDEKSIDFITGEEITKHKKFKI